MQATETLTTAQGTGAERPGKKVADIERLRGVAILLVVFLHLPVSGLLFIRLGLDPERRSFWLAVHLFFVISGYVVTKSFLASGLSVWKFYVRRVFRLWPVLLAFFAFSALVNCFPTAHTSPWEKWAEGIPPILFAYMTVYQATHAIEYPNQAMWSLSVEEQFYLVVPALLVLLWCVCRVRERGCARFFLAVYVALAVVLRLGVAFDWELGIYARWYIPWAVHYVVIWQFDFMALGVILYFRLRQPRPLLARLPAPLQCPLAWACLTLPFVLIAAFGTRDFLPWGQPPLNSVGLLLAGLGFYAVVGLATLDKDLLYTGRWLDRVLMYWGTRSYGIYVFHYPILAFTYWLAPIPSRFGYFNRHDIAYEVVRTVLALGVGLPVIELLHRYVEQPGINLGRRLIQRLSGKARAAAPQATPAAPVQRAA